MGAGWRIELMGWLRAVRGDSVVQRFRSQKAATRPLRLTHLPAPPPAIWNR